MAVHKLRDIGEAPALSWSPKRAERFRSAFELSHLCLRLSRRPILRGIRRYRSIEDRPDKEA